MPLKRFLILAVLLITSAGFAAQQISVWPVDSLIKVFPDDAPGTNRASQEVWLVARNGHTSLQFAIRSSALVEALSATVKLAGGLQAQVRRVGYVPVRSNPPRTPADEVARVAPAKFPDPLLEDVPFPLKANETTPVWITVYGPAKTPPGVYKGEAVFRSGMHRLARLSFSIQVMAPVVPAKQTLKVTNWLNLDESHLAHYYDLASNPERYWDVLSNVAHVMAYHRQNVIITPVLSLTDAHVDGGTVTYDFTRLDRWIEIFNKAGAAELIEGGHILDRASGYDSPLKVGAFVVENGQVQRQMLDPDDPRAEAHLDSFLPALYSHLKQKGWLDRYVQHVLDEAHGAEPPVYLRYVKIIRKNLPGVLTIDAIDQTAELLGEACDIWVPQLGKFDDGFDTIREHVKKGGQAGQAWFYTCLYPQGRYLNRFIDYPLLKTRLLHWFNFRYDFTGFLHWGGNYWDGDPFTNVEAAIENGKQVLPAGDAFITYPWRQKNSIHSSIRLEAMREGIEDYELLRALAATNPDRAQQLARRAISGASDYVRDVPSFRRLQGELLGLSIASGRLALARDPRPPDHN